MNNDKALGKKTKKEYMREYMRQYRKNNKEKIKEINERYWINRARKDGVLLELN
ncbi:hypothetical protein [Clostridium tarantellae]|uniref:hypothetical protein n=1 Tax=Clostridium tarantellae TaxID=39493 RepID=UPI0014791643|nr:hypothetical protein [Clostridium tarantellae]